MCRSWGINGNPFGFSLVLLLLLCSLHTGGCKIDDRGLLLILFTVTVCLKLPDSYTCR